MLEFSVVFLALLSVVLAGELTFELPDNEKQCFHEIIDKGTKSTIEFQVSLKITHFYICINI